MLVQSSHSTHAKRRTLKENKSVRAKTRKVPELAVLIDLICSGMVSRKQFCRLTCQRGSASQMMRGRYQVAMSESKYAGVERIELRDAFHPDDNGNQPTQLLVIPFGQLRRNRGQITKQPSRAMV